MKRNLPSLAFFLLAMVAGVAIYGRGLNYPLIFDDLDAIRRNASIRELGALPGVFAPPADTPVAVRPVVNLSFALNYSLHGERPAGYRAVNLAVHVACACLLFGVLRRAARRVVGGEAITPAMKGFAAAVALLWLAHPLNTEAVIYITQRTELMMAACYLLTLYAAARGWEPPEAESNRSRGAWHAIAVLACAAGMASKEVMVSAPLFVWLFDRTLVSGSFRQALRRSPWLYAGLAATWGVLAFLLATQTRGQTAGFGVGVSPLHYLFTQAGAILWYLRLCFWPHPLAVAHDWPLQASLLAALPAGLCVLALLGVTAWLLCRKSWLGLAGAWFFLILAPTSSVVPIVTEVVAERRMYLPSAAVILVVAYGVARAIRLLPRRHVATAVSVTVLVVALGVASAARVGDYASVTRIWADAAKRFPDSATAAHNLAAALLEEGRPNDALREADRAAALEPNNWATQTLRGRIFLSLDRPAEAERAFRAALRLNPSHAEAHDMLGVALYMRARQPAATQPAAVMEEAASHYREAIRLNPTYAEPHHNLATVLGDLGRLDEAAREYAEAIRLKPDLVDANVTLARLLAHLGRLDEAAPAFERAIGLVPRDARLRDELGVVYARRGELERAIAAFRASLAIDPNYRPAKEHLARATSTGE